MNTRTIPTARPAIIQIPGFPLSWLGVLPAGVGTNFQRQREEDSPIVLAVPLGTVAERRFISAHQLRYAPIEPMYVRHLGD